MRPVARTKFSRFCVAASIAAVGAVVLLIVPLLTPAVAEACCADIERQTPIAWSADGSRLLVETYSSTECVGRSVAEVRRTGSASASERYDLQDGGRSLGRLEEGRALDMDELYERSEAAGEGEELFPIPDSLTRRFGRPARALCARDIYARASADPSDPLDTPAYESHVLISVRVRVGGELVQVADPIRLPRFFAESGQLYIHPTPDGRRAIVRVNTDGPELAADDLTWVALPTGVTLSEARCDNAAQVFPSPDNAREPMVEPGDNWLLESAVQTERELGAGSGAVAGLSDVDAAALLVSQLVGGLWAEPDHHSARAALVAALERAGSDDLADAVAADLPDGPVPLLADVVTGRPIEEPSEGPSDVGVFCDGANGADGADGANGADGGSCTLPFELPADAAGFESAGDDVESAPALSCAVTNDGAGAEVILLPALLLLGLGGLGLAIRRRRR